jgi:hypothetical protein
MSNLKLSLLAGSLMASAAMADVTIDIPAPATTVSTKSQVGADTTSAGALSIKNMSGATYYIGHASTGQLSETSAGELSLQYSLTYAAADGNYGTAVGILLPLTASWDIKDLTAMTSITFQMKMATTGAKAHLIIGSDGYPSDMAAENSALTSNDVAITTAYATITVLPGDLLTPTWAKAASAATTGWIADGTTYTTGIAPVVKDLNFQPVLNWTSATVLKSDAASVNTMSLKNVKIAGISKWNVPHGSSCSGAKYFTLDDFSTATGRTTADANYYNTYWYVFTDTTSDAARINDTAVGNSKVVLPTGKRAWAWTANAGAFLTANLDKNVPTSTYTYHKYAGWADIGTDLTDAEGNPSDFSSFTSGNMLTGISFDLYAGASAAPIVTGATFDTNLVERIIFKVGNKSAPDAAPYQISIAADSAVTGWTGAKEGLTSICVDVSALAQPGWYVKDSAGGISSPLPISELTKLSWEAKIEDQKDPTKATAAVTFGVGNVTLWGINAADLVSGVKGSKVRGAALRAAYNSGLVLSYAVPGTSAQIEVLRLDGSKVASFKAGATASNLSLPVSLTRGNYLVTVAGASKRLTSTLAVAR